MWGAGKFLLTEALAKKRGWDVIDANSSLERYIRRSLNEILGKQGDEALHRFEAEIISHLRNIMKYLLFFITVIPFIGFSLFFWAQPANFMGVQKNKESR